MNIKSTLSRYVFLVCFPFVGLSQPTKTLTEPSILPSISFTVGDRDNDQTDFDHGESLGLLIKGMCDVSEILLLIGGNSQSNLGLFRIEFSGATQGVILGESTDTIIDIADTGTTTVTVTPRVKSLQSLSFDKAECPIERRLYEFSEVYLEARYAANDSRKKHMGKREHQLSIVPKNWVA